MARPKGALPRFSQAPQHVPSPKLGGAAGYFQFVTSAGKISRPPREKERLPVDSRAQAVAAGTRKAFFSDQTVADTRVRVYTAQVSKGVAVQIARPLTEVDNALSRIRLLLLVVSAGGVALAAALGLLVARTTLVPVRRLTRAAERIAATRDLRSRVGDGRGDELGRLAKAFDIMLDALATSVDAQRQLVADASHELRTPLASIRTNLEVLELDEGMPLAERRRILADAVGELAEMTHLIEELVELARGEQHALELDRVRLDLVVRDAVAASARRVPAIRFDARLDPTLVHGSAQALTRAVANLLDNACKVEPGGSRRRRDGCERRGDRARPRPRRRRGRSGARVRPLLPLCGLTDAAGLRARTGDRAPDRGGARRLCQRRAGARRRLRVSTAPAGTRLGCAQRVTRGIRLLVVRNRGLKPR